LCPIQTLARIYREQVANLRAALTHEEFQIEAAEIMRTHSIELARRGTARVWRSACPAGTNRPRRCRTRRRRGHVTLVLCCIRVGSVNYRTS
jgi:hypothetical protein